MTNLPVKLNQKGSVPLPVLVAIIGVISFLVFAFYAPFKDQLLTALYPKPTSEASQARFSPDTVLVKFKDSASKEEKDKAISENSATDEKEIDKIKVKVLKVASGKVEETVERLKKNPNVEFAEPDYIFEKSMTPNDPKFSSQWDYVKVKDPQAFDITLGSSSVAIAVLDTGVQTSHPDLASKIKMNANFSDTASYEDVDGHGTHTTGTAGTATNNGVGVAGSCPNCSLMNGKVMDDTANGQYSWLASGIIWAADNGAKVISMSLGGTGASSTTQSAVDYAWGKGVVLVAAAGNYSTTSPLYPAYYDNTIAVASTDPNDVKASSSSYGSWVDIAAPGVSILSTCVSSSYCNKSGTSMATPHVAGLAGLIFSIHPDWTSTQVRQAIENGADKINGTGTYWAYGRINAYNSVNNVPGGTPLPSSGQASPTPTPPPAEVIPPTVSITSPANGSTVKRNSAFTISADASDNAAVSKVEFYVDGGLKGADSTSPYSLNTKISGKTGASHTIQARAYDTSGNASSASISITVR